MPQERWISRANLTFRGDRGPAASFRPAHSKPSAQRPIVWAVAHRTIALVGVVLLASTPLVHAQSAGNTSRQDTLRLLRARKFDQLDEIVRSAQAATERDIRHEAGLVRILHAFDTTDP